MVFPARLFERWRCGFSELLGPVAHPVQLFRKAPGGLRSPSAVVLGFIYRFAVQVGEPGLDIPPRNEDDHGVHICSWRDLLGLAFLIELGYPLLRRVSVRVDDDDQPCALLAANGSQLIRVLFSNPLLSGLGAVWKVLRMDGATGETCCAQTQESTYERVRALILTEQYDLSAHSQRLAMVSDSERPSTTFFGSLLTRTGPFPSRENHLPLAPAM